jgi:hypothetical protein
MMALRARTDRRHHEVQPFTGLADVQLAVDSAGAVYVADTSFSGGVSRVLKLTGGSNATWPSPSTATVLRSDSAAGR